MTTTIMIPINRIKDPTWNSRLAKQGRLAKLEHEKIAAMAAEFQDPKIGQLTPIEVEDLGDGWYELVIGSRRRAAATVAGWKEIRANVYPVSSDADRAFRNIVENTSRENLTPFETARAAARLRDLGLKNPDIGTKLKISASHVSNLNTAYTQLPAPILKDWEAQNPVATEQTLCAIARNFKSEDDKVRAWDAAVAEAAERAAEGQKPGKRGKAKKGSSSGFPVSQKRLGHLVEALSSKGGSPDLEDATRKWGKAILDYIVQARETTPAGVPKMPEKAAKGAKDDE